VGDGIAVKFTVLSLFPDILKGFFDDSIMSRAVNRGLVDYELVNIRDYAYDKHRVCDDSPYGGGAGMVLKPEPLSRALDAAGAGGKRVVFPTPSGRPFTQRLAEELADEDELVFICGRYEGIDQRVIDLYVDDEISIGDYVISSGEIATLVIVDAVYRLLGGVITRDSLEEESFTQPLLEYPHYTRPEEFRGLRVPEILLGGHHANIKAWRLRKRVEKTLMNRPDLLKADGIDEEIRRVRDKLQETSEG
jgi:tRNA (guanine37-N1)-methyltransferase